MLPEPADAYDSLSGWRRASSISSFRLFAGTEGCTATTNGPCESWTIGVMSFTGSNDSLYRLGFTV